MSRRTWLVLAGIVLLFNIVFYLPLAKNSMTSQGAQTTLRYSAFLARSGGQ